MDLLDFMLKPYTAWAYRKWKREFDEKLRQIEREVNEDMLGMKVITQEEITAELKENLRAIRKLCRPSLWERVKRFLRG